MTFLPDVLALNQMNQYRILDITQLKAPAIPRNGLTIKDMARGVTRLLLAVHLVLEEQALVEAILRVVRGVHTVHAASVAPGTGPPHIRHMADAESYHGMQVRGELIHERAARPYRPFGEEYAEVVDALALLGAEVVVGRCALWRALWDGGLEDVDHRGEGLWCGLEVGEGRLSIDDCLLYCRILAVAIREFVSTNWAF